MAFSMVIVAFSFYLNADTLRRRGLAMIATFMVQKVAGRLWVQTRVRLSGHWKNLCQLNSKSVPVLKQKRREV